MPPPGAPPLSCWICTPGSFPCRSFSIVGVGTWLIWSALTTSTLFAEFCEETVVLTPVTTCASR